MTPVDSPLLPWSQADEERRRQRIEELRRRLAALAPPAPDWSGTAADLPSLQRLLDGPGGEDPTARHAIESGFAHILAHELGLSFAVSPEGGQHEPVLRYRDTEVVFYPCRMLARQLATGPSVDLAMLLRNTRDYLINLQRFLFTSRKKRKGAGNGHGTPGNASDSR